jgi:hypothetical protein
MTADLQPVLLRVVYAANVLVAGVVGGLALFAPAAATRTVFSGTAEPSAGLRVVGSFWLVIAALSAVGCVYPRAMVVVLVVQLGYKGLWLAAVAVPAVLDGRADTLPGGMAVFFAVWVAVLPFVIPWSDLLRD